MSAAVSGAKRPRPTAAAAAKEPAAPAPVREPKPRVLIFGGRGMTARYRHLMMDIRALVPHHKKDAKLDAKDQLSVINEIADSKSCNTTLYFEVRKKRDLFLWLAATPSGPSVKFHVVNVHTMDELRMSGNCLKGSRPILSFDSAFDDAEGAPHLRLVRELLCRTFATPKGHPKSQPFHDHVMAIGHADGKVWFRHYQIVDNDALTDPKKAAAVASAAAAAGVTGDAPVTLVEIGPRFVLDIVRVFGGSFGGPTLWANPEYVAPNAARRQIAVAKADKYTARQLATQGRKVREEELVLPSNPVDEVFRDEHDGEEADGEALKAGATGKKAGAAAAVGGAGTGKRAAADDDDEEDEDEDDEEIGSDFDEDDEEEDEEEDGDDDDEEEEEEEVAPPPKAAPAKRARTDGVADAGRSGAKAAAAAAAPAPPAAAAKGGKKAAPAAAAPAPAGKKGAAAAPAKRR